MLNTKLILVDGIQGSGKSTLAHYLARQLEMNGIKAKWFYEIARDNPFRLYDCEANSWQEWVEHFHQGFPASLESCLEKIDQGDTVYIIEAHLFQTIISRFVYEDFEYDRIEEFYDRYTAVLAKCKPIVIHLYHEDPLAGIEANFQRREYQTNVPGWFKQQEQSAYCLKRNLTGRKAYDTLWSLTAEYALKLFHKLDFRKLLVENSAHDWSAYRRQILDFLQLKQFEEELFNPEFIKYCRKYSYDSQLVNVHIKDNCLYFDSFWPNFKLIQVDIDTFEIEGVPGTIQFLKEADGSYQSFKVIHGSRHYEENSIYKIPYQPHKSEIERFCGDYWCEADKILRRIYHKDDRFYYWRNEENFEELLLKSAQNMSLINNNRFNLEFDFSNEKHRFMLKVENQEPVEFVKMI